MRHHDGEAAIGGGHASQAVGRAVGIKRVSRRHLAAIVDVAHGRQHPARRRRIGELGAAFAVADHYRQFRTRHAVEEDRRRLRNLDHHHARLELFAAVALESRPVLRAGDDRRQVGHHLATVADAQREAVGASEEGAEFVAQAVVEQHRLGPALPGAEHVAVGKAAAGGEALEIGQMHAADLQVGHVHVVGRETGTLESGGHFDVAVDALVAKNRNRRLLASNYPPPDPVPVGGGD